MIGAKVTWAGWVGAEPYRPIYIRLWVGVGVGVLRLHYTIDSKESLFTTGSAIGIPTTEDLY